MISLQTKDLSKEFPGVIALDKVNLSVEKGEIHAIVGENGAGKSTLVKIISGVYHQTKGEYFIEGEKKQFHSPKDASEFIGVVHQERELVPHFTGYQNLFLGLELTKGGFLLKKEMKRKTKRFIQKYNLDVDLDLPASDLSSGQQEMLTILKVLFRDPKIIIFDEPTAPLSIKESEILFRLIRDLKKKGLTIIYISHHLSEILDLSDSITVLRNGQKVDTIKNDDVTERQLINLMISKDMQNQYPKVKTEINEVIFEVKDYTPKKIGFKNINFNIRSGEIVGFAGLVGSGRTELAKSIFSGNKLNSGSIELYKKNFKSRNSKKSIDSGLVMIPEDRRGEGLLVNMTVKENIIMPHLSSLTKGGFTSENKIKEYVKNIIEKFSIKVFSPLQEVRTLSGGNQQKVSVGKWLGENANIWIFDEPTQGIDVDAKTEIYSIMGNIAKEGAGVWFISSDLKELVAISDRIYVMHEFEIVSEFKPPFDKEAILSKMMGEI